MPYLIGTQNNKPMLASTEWVAALIMAEFRNTHPDVNAESQSMPEFNLHVDFGGMISTSGTPRLHLDHEDGEFRFYAHQRSGIVRLLEAALKAAGRDEYIKLESQVHILCITTEHALDILFRMEEDIIKEEEGRALKVCSDLIDSARKLPGAVVSQEHNLAMV